VRSKRTRRALVVILAAFLPRWWRARRIRARRVERLRTETQLLVGDESVALHKRVNELQREVETLTRAANVTLDFVEQLQRERDEERAGARLLIEASRRPSA
jgi:hypothetical protein